MLDQPIEHFSAQLWKFPLAWIALPCHEEVSPHTK
jgi:hypothetical protein